MSTKLHFKIEVNIEESQTSPEVNQEFPEESNLIGAESKAPESEI